MDDNVLFVSEYHIAESPRKVGFVFDKVKDEAVYSTNAIPCRTYKRNKQLPHTFALKRSSE